MRRRGMSSTRRKWILGTVVTEVTLALLYVLGLTMPIAIILGIGMVLAAKGIRKRWPGKAAMIFTIAAVGLIAVFSWPVALMFGAWEFAWGVKRLMGWWAAVAFVAAAIGLIAALFLPPGSALLWSIRKIVTFVLMIFGAKVFLVRECHVLKDWWGEPLPEAMVLPGSLTVSLFGLALAILAGLDFFGIVDVLGWAVIILCYLGRWLAMPNVMIAAIVVALITAFVAAIWLTGIVIASVVKLVKWIGAQASSAIRKLKQVVAKASPT